MNNYRIAILITTFLRDNLLYKTLQTIIDNYSNDCIVLVADQGYSSSEKLITIDYFKSQIPMEYYQLPFDSGIAIAKNLLVQKASEIHISYCLVMPDSIQFKEVYNFTSLFEDLNNNILINFKLKNVKSIELQNIFLAKTENLIKLWDEEMKIYDYQLAFAEYMIRGYKISWNEDYQFIKVKCRASEEYFTYCKRLKDYQKLSLEKMEYKNAHR